MTIIVTYSPKPYKKKCVIIKHTKMSMKSPHISPFERHQVEMSRVRSGRVRNDPLWAVVHYLNASGRIP